LFIVDNSATTTRKRQRQPQRLDPYPAGSERAIESVRSYIAGEERRRREGEAWKAVLRARERSPRRTFM